MVEGLKISGADAILDAIIGGRAVTLILVLRRLDQMVYADYLQKHHHVI